MKTAVDCMPCFIAQALKAGRIATDNKALHKKILVEVARSMIIHEMDVPPPVMGKRVQDIVKKISGQKDPYKNLKKDYNVFAMKLYPVVKARVAKSKDRLLTAVRAAIAGNIIDFGVNGHFDMKKELNEAFTAKSALFDAAEFRRVVKKAKNILYLADNAGETVFDRVLIEEIRELNNCNIVYAVKEKPVINDAMLEDAKFSGLDKCAKIISSGSALPGIMPGKGTNEFLKLYKNADVIISKGQGNYELLREEKKPIFFLLKVKCDVIAEDLGLPIGSIVLKYALK
jgi:uncharacterized protein with ATP-grasp and redox domains